MPIVWKKASQASNQNQTPAKSSISPFIDRLSLIIKPAVGDAQDMLTELVKITKDEQLYQSVGPAAKKGYRIAKRILLQPASEHGVLMQASVEKETGQLVRLRFEFNPNAIGYSGIEMLHTVMMNIMPNGWDYAFKYGHISRIDVAAELPSTRPDHFSALPAFTLSSKEYSSSGKLQTLYLGKPKGKQLVIYNKKQEQLSKKLQWIGKASTRIEARLKGQNLSIQALPSLPNPFSGLKLLALPPEGPLAKDQWIWSLFLDSVKVRGLPAAFALLQEKRRTTYRKFLEQHPHPLWDPELIWENWVPHLTTMKMHEIGHFD